MISISFYCDRATRMALFLILIISLVFLQEAQGSHGLSSPKVHVVIARFAEDISHLLWLSAFPHTIYNRGDDVHNTSLKIVTRLENVGRESFLYLSHIVQHYHRLPETLVFSQAVQSVRHIYNDDDFRKDVEDFAIGKLSFSASNDGFAFCLPGCSSARDPRHIDDLFKRYQTREIFDSGYERLLNFSVANPRFSGTGSFFVHKSAILRNPREYYVRLARVLGRENDPVQGHFFERAWPEVFHSNCSGSPRFSCLFDKYSKFASC